MKRFIQWFVSGARGTIAEFFGQALGLLILLFGLAAWAYFDSIYAALPVLFVGVLLLAVIYRVGGGGR